MTAASKFAGNLQSLLEAHQLVAGGSSSHGALPSTGMQQGLLGSYCGRCLGRCLQTEVLAISAAELYIQLQYHLQLCHADCMVTQ